MCSCTSSHTQSTTLTQHCRTAGILGSLFSLPQFFAAPLIGASSDIVGRKKMLLLSMVSAHCVSMVYLLFAGRRKRAGSSAATLLPRCLADCLLHDTPRGLSSPAGKAVKATFPISTSPSLAPLARERWRWRGCFHWFLPDSCPGAR